MSTQHAPSVAPTTVATLMAAASEPEWLERFDEVAITVYEWQRARVPAYDMWCENELRQRPAGRRSVTRADEVPALAIGAFKLLSVHAPGAAAAATWRSSGTSGAERSTHVMESLAHYDAAIDAATCAMLVPDVASDTAAPLACVQLHPSAADAPTSSLTYMFDRIRQSAWCTSAAVTVGADWQLDVDATVAALEAACTRQVAVLVLSTSIALDQLVTTLAARGLAIELPVGSRVVDTGGFKGQAREVSAAALADDVARWLGVQPAMQENEYGMSELTSQSWTGRIAQTLAGDAARADVGRWTLPWHRVRVVDPQTLEPVADGETGLIVHHDLANVWSCACIRTEDLGVRRGASFELVGRAPGAVVKGCSLQLADMVDA